MNYVYTYTVVVYDGANQGYHLESGLLMARSYTNAAEQLEEFYSTSLTRILDLAETDNEMIILPSSIVYNYARGTYDECIVPCNQWGNKLTEFDNETATDTKIDWNVQEPVKTTTTTAEI